MNTFDFRKQLTPDQLLIIRGTYERPDETTGADWNIEWDEIVIAQSINGVHIETDLLPFINEVAGTQQVIEHGLFQIIDDLVYLYLVGKENND